MKQQHKDINKVIPYGEALRGFVNQSFVSSADIIRLLKRRGIFALEAEKDYTAPLMQLLLLSPIEFDDLKDAFNTKEDNKKTISKDVNFTSDKQLFEPQIMSVDVGQYLKKSLPTCDLASPVRFNKVNGDPNHIKTEFTLKRTDLNKSWYEQTNLFEASIEFINNNGKGRVVITHTAPETKDLATYIASEQVKKFKANKIISEQEKLREIKFNTFSNEERFAFFYSLTTQLDCEYFTCKNIKDISIKPEENMDLPDDIQWMENMKRIIISGEALDKKYFMRDTKYHQNLILWSIEAEFDYSFNGEQGRMIVYLGFPDYSKSRGGENAEFELQIAAMTPKVTLD